MVCENRNVSSRKQNTHLVVLFARSIRETLPHWWGNNHQPALYSQDSPNMPHSFVFFSFESQKWSLPIGVIDAWTWPTVRTRNRPDAVPSWPSYFGRWPMVRTVPYLQRRCWSFVLAMILLRHTLGSNYSSIWSAVTSTNWWIRCALLLGMTVVGRGIPSIHNSYDSNMRNRRYDCSLTPATALYTPFTCKHKATESDDICCNHFWSSSIQLIWLVFVLWTAFTPPRRIFCF